MRRLLVLAAALALTAPAARAAEACGRDCLTRIADQYMDAMAAQKPDGLPWAPTVRYSENGVPMAIGDGLWGAISAHGKTALKVADPKTGEVAWIGEIEEHGQAGFYAMRMKVVGGRIAAVDAVIRRLGGPPEYSDPTKWTPDPAFAEPEKRPLPRVQLIAAVNAYLDAMQGSAKAPPRFAPDCGRKVNGVVVTAGKTATGGVEGCAAQIKAGVFKPVEQVRARRLTVVDEARGIVVAEGFQDFPETLDAYAGRPAPAKYPYSLGFIAAFKIKDGGVYCVEEISTALPYLMPAP
ncbi:MAG: hypothetical protein ACXU82_14925 [Caulobacteraceae bacterium]